MLMAIYFVANMFATGGVAASGAAYRYFATKSLQENHILVRGLLGGIDEVRHLGPEIYRRQVIGCLQSACQSSFGECCLRDEASSNMGILTTMPCSRSSFRCGFEHYSYAFDADIRKAQRCSR
jgi:hypothetical protein